MADRHSDSQEQDVSLKDAMKAVKAQAKYQPFREPQTWYKWKYEGNKVHFLFNSELLEELTRSIWAIDNSKVEYARETITDHWRDWKDKKKAINILRLQLAVMGVGRLFDNTRVIQSLATRMMRLKSTKQKIGRYVNATQRVKRLS